MNFNTYKEIHFSNFVYNADVYYFLYIGEIKAYGLNHGGSFFMG